MNKIFTINIGKKQKFIATYLIKDLRSTTVP